MKKILKPLFEIFTYSTVTICTVLSVIVGSYVLYYWWNSKTVYAANFKQEKFEKIEVGMEPDAILELLGAPLDTWGSANQSGGWNYSKSADRRGDHFILKYIEFKNGKVEYKLDVYDD